MYASAVGFADALWLCPERALRRLFASVSLLAPGALSPLLHRVFPDGFRHRCTFRFCGEESLLLLGPVGTLGEVAVAPRISPYTGPGWSSPFCRVSLVLQSVFTVRHSARIHGDHLVSFPDSCVSLVRHPPYGVVPWTLAWRVTGWTYRPPPRSSSTLSFALTSGHDSTVLIPPAIDSGESPSFTVGLTNC